MGPHPALERVRDHLRQDRNRTHKRRRSNSKRRVGQLRFKGSHSPVRHELRGLAMEPTLASRREISATIFGRAAGDRLCCLLPTRRVAEYAEAVSLQFSPADSANLPRGLARSDASIPTAIVLRRRRIQGKREAQSSAFGNQASRRGFRRSCCARRIDAATPEYLQVKYAGIPKSRFRQSHRSMWMSRGSKSGDTAFAITCNRRPHRQMSLISNPNVPILSICVCDPSHQCEIPARIDVKVQVDSAERPECLGEIEESVGIVLRRDSQSEILKRCR